MAKSTDTTTAAPAAPKPSELDNLLTLATDKTKDEMGPTPTNKAVSTTINMTSAVTENGNVTTTSINAGVNLGTTTTTTKAPESK